MSQITTIGFGITASFCTFDKIKNVIKQLSNDTTRVIPIFSFMTHNVDSRFGKSEEFVKTIQELTKEKGIFTIPEAEPIGPKKILDVLVVAPCTGNTLAKMARGITDSTILMAAKAHLRNERPIVIGISTNDGLGANFENIGILLNRKNIFFVPFGQDDCDNKPNSLVAHWDLVAPTIDYAKEKRQIQPVILSPFKL